MQKKEAKAFITKNNVGKILAKQGINNVKLNGKDLKQMGIVHVDDFHKIINQEIPLSMDPEAEVNNAHKIAAWLKVTIDELAEEITEDLKPEEQETDAAIRKNRLAEIWKKNDYHQLNLVPSSYKNMGVADKEEFERLLKNEAEFGLEEGEKNDVNKMANWLGVKVEDLIDFDDYKA